MYELVIVFVDFRLSSSERKAGSRDSSMDGRKSSSRDRRERHKDKNKPDKNVTEDIDKVGLKRLP